jgi:hypothetical protein
MKAKNNEDNSDNSSQLKALSEVEKKGQYHNDLFCLLARYSALEVSGIYVCIHIFVYILFIYNVYVCICPYNEYTL